MEKISEYCDYPIVNGKCGMCGNKNPVERENRPFYIVQYEIGNIMKDKFKSSNLKELIPEEFNTYTVKDIGECSYGYDENGLGYFFIFVNKAKEGFLWYRTSYKEDGVYKGYEKVITTESFSKYKNLFEKHTNLNLMRETHLERIRSENPPELSLDQIFTEVTFGRFGQKINRRTKFKILGLMMINLMYKFRVEYKKDIPQEIEESLSKQRENDVYWAPVSLLNKNILFVEVLLSDLDYIMKNKVSLKSIMEKVESC
jgi:hypothetical protein